MNLEKKSGFYETLFENLLEGCQVISPDWKYLYVNKVVCQQARRPKEALLGKRMGEVFPGLEQSPMFAKLQKCMDQRIHISMLNDFAHLDGSMGRFILSMEPVSEGVLILSTDITAQEENEDRVAKLNRLYRVLSNINQTIVRERDITTVLAAACRVAVKEGGFSLAWIGVPDASHTKLHPIAYAGVDGTDAYLDQLDISLAGDLSSIGPVENLFREGRHSVCAVLPIHDRSGLLGNSAHALGCRSAAFLPIGPLKGPRGIMGVFSTQENVFDAEELDLLKEIALDLGLAMEIAESEAQRKRAEAELLESEEKYRVLFQSSSEGILVADMETWCFSYANPAACRMFGYTEQEFKTLKVTDIHPPEHLLEVGTQFEAVLTGAKTQAEAQPCLTQGGATFYADISTSPVMIQGRACNVGFFTDVTQRRILQKQLYQSQKLEAVGQLAGGVAHDFNNLLSAIMGYGDIMKMHLKHDDPLYKSVEQILKCSDRAAALTRQLLAFSRKQILEPQVLNLNTVMREVESMLNRLIGEHIELQLHPASDLGSIKADPGQVEQIIVNLVLNSRDAMPKGGRLTLETAEVFLDESYAERHVGTLPGPYVMLAVTDTGEGMDEATRSRIFEPFFTTKKEGMGTGLGLATVYGIVKQSGGSIWMYSELGKGSTFKIYLPRVDEKPLENPATKTTALLRGGGETILVAEDEEANREIICEMLKISGYLVIPAKNGAEALRAAQSHEGAIHLLITDVVMPGMSGKQLAQELSVARPDIKVLYTSGYTDNTIVHHGVLDEGTAFLEKPFNLKGLTGKIRSVLDAG